MTYFFLGQNVLITDMVNKGTFFFFFPVVPSRISNGSKEQQFVLLKQKMLRSNQCDYHLIPQWYGISVEKK